MKKILIIIVSLFVVASAIAWYLLNMEFDNTENLTPEYKMQAVQFLKEFDNNNAEANKKYSDRIIQISGEVNDIEYADTTINIKMTNPESSSYIIFSFQSDHMKTVKKVKRSDLITIKGSCSGAIYSEIFEANAVSFKRCVIIKN